MPYFDRVQAFSFFVSPARSGHSIIGQLLSAHPDVLYADELGAVTKIDEGYSADQVYALIRAQDLHLQNRGRAKSGYDYKVDGAWQNVPDKRPRVIGDAKGARATTLLAGGPGFAERVRAAVGVPIRAVVHLRDPFDIVGSRVKRRGRRLDDAIRGMRIVHDEILAAIGTLREDERLIQYHEDVIADPTAAFERMFAFLGVEPNPEAVRACAGKLWARPHAARKAADWPDESVAALRALIDESPILGRYADPPASEPPTPPAAAPAPPPTPRPRNDDRTGYFDRVERFTLLLSPQNRGVAKLGLTLSGHPDVLLSDELSDELDERGFLLEPYTRGQVLALLKHQNFRQLARQRKHTNDTRRSIEVYKTVQDRRPTSVGITPGPGTIRALAEDEALLDRLSDRLGVPLRVAFYFKARSAMRRFLAGEDAGGSLEASMNALRRRLGDDNTIVTCFDDLAGAPAERFAEMYRWLGVEPADEAIAACAKRFRAAPKTYAAKKPWWLKPAQALKRRVKRLRGVGKAGPRR
ncbi:MAG: hypothetical protein AAFY08_13335 [Planctomycetota bacterium]